MLVRHIKIAGLCALVGLGVWCASVGRAAGRDEGKLIAVVDIDIISEQAAPFKAEREAFESMQERLDQELTARMFMNAEETQQLESLLNKAKRTPEDEKKLQALIQDGLKRDQELKSLQIKVNKNAQELARLRELESLVKRNRDDVSELMRRYQEKLQKDNLDARKRLSDKVKEASREVGSKKGYVLVIPKDLALWSNASIDVTQDVLGYLNAKR
ncbi:MAG: OmpH family outer membrane protein [Abditibacteriales bacterium]|nr:OmpH family outer membrane protein [Abditibacteriales bacterium]MDW8364531.1 OmpH family outer membrane protein [Abditibacteriales bacterium]